MLPISPALTIPHTANITTSSTSQSRTAQDVLQRDTLESTVDQRLANNLRQSQAPADLTSEMTACSQVSATHAVAQTDNIAAGCSTAHHAVQLLVAGRHPAALTGTKANMGWAATAQSVTSAETLLEAKHISVAASTEGSRSSLPASILPAWQKCPINKVSMHMCA